MLWKKQKRLVRTAKNLTVMDVFIGSTEMDDYISRQAAIYMARDDDMVIMVTAKKEDIEFEIVEQTRDAIARRIEELPSADVQPVKRGNWTTKQILWHVGEYYCDQCGRSHPALIEKPKDRYCRWCGAKMTDEKDEEPINNFKKKGKWIPLGHRPGYLKHPWSEDYKCSLCGYEAYTILMEPPELCPNCHAEMIKEKNNDQSTETR